MRRLNKVGVKEKVEKEEAMEVKEKEKNDGEKSRKRKNLFRGKRSSRGREEGRVERMGT